MPLYDYGCHGCDNQFTESLSVDNRKIPTESPCTECGGEVFQRLTGTSLVSDYKSPHRRAGTEWQDILKKVKKESGRNNTIKV